MTNPRVVLVKAEGCPGCEKLVSSVEAKPEIREEIKRLYGTDKIETVDVTRDTLAIDIIRSLDNYEVPMVTVLEDGHVCLLDDDVRVKKCAPLQDVTSSTSSSTPRPTRDGSP